MKFALLTKFSYLPQSCLCLPFLSYWRKDGRSITTRPRHHVTTISIVSLQFRVQYTKGRFEWMSGRISKSAKNASSFYAFNIANQSMISLVTYLSQENFRLSLALYTRSFARVFTNPYILFLPSFSPLQLSHTHPASWKIIPLTNCPPDSLKEF